MNKKAVLAGLGSGVIAGVLLAFVALNIAAPITSSDDLGGTIGVKLVLEIHRADGTTEKYVKEGDLILKNFAVLITLLTSGKKEPDSADKSLLSPSGSSIVPQSYINFDSRGLICIGSGTTPPTLNDYSIENEIACIPVQDADIIINETDMTIDIFTSYTVDTAVNVTEVGLRTIAVGVTSDSISYKYYIFRDVLANPIQLNAGDGITVHYYIFLDNP